MNDVSRAEKKRATMWESVQRHAEKEAKRALKRQAQRAAAAGRAAEEKETARARPAAEEDRGPALTVLGCTRESSPEEIRAAYRRLALQWHPDKNPTEGATVVFQRIQNAWAVLSA